MLYALDINLEKIKAVQGAKAICPVCKKIVIAKCGLIKIHHWAHANLEDCDNWSEGETEWHLKWKEYQTKDKIEVVMGNHRADIVNNHNTVIELQNSPISAQEIMEREFFYNNMVWLFNGEKFQENICFYDKKTHHSFNWKWSHKSKAICLKQLYIDIPKFNKIFVVKKQYDGFKCGWGYFMSYDDFINKIIIGEKIWKI